MNDSPEVQRHLRWFGSSSSAGLEIATLPSECRTGLSAPLCTLLSHLPPTPGLRMCHSHSGDVFSWEGIGGVADKEAGFPHSSGRERKNIAGNNGSAISLARVR